MSPPAPPKPTPEQIRARIAEKLGPTPKLQHRDCDACEGLGVLYDARDVGRRIAAWRASLGLTKQDVADQLEVSRPYYTNLEMGERHWHTGRILEVIGLLEREENLQAAGKPRPGPKPRRRSLP